MEIRDHRAQPPALGIGFLEPMDDRVELGLGAGDGRSWLQAADHRQGVAPTIGFVADWKRAQKIDACVGSEERSEVEGRGQYAHDFGRRVVEGDRAADDARITPEPPLPERLGENYRRSATPDPFFVDEVASVDGLNPQHVEEVPGDVDADKPFGLTFSHQVVARRLEEREVAGESIEGLVQRPEIAQIRRPRRDRGHAA